MSTEKMREDFQVWQCDADDGPQTDPIWMIYDAAGNYGIAEIQRDWETWQASRAAIEVELPAPYESFSGVFHAEDGEDPDLSMSAHEVRQAIESIGLRIKP